MTAAVAVRPVNVAGVELLATPDDRLLSRQQLALQPDRFVLVDDAPPPPPAAYGPLTCSRTACVGFPAGLMFDTIDRAFAAADAHVCKTKKGAL